MPGQPADVRTDTMDGAERRRRAVALFLVVFVMVLAGSFASLMFDLRAGPGDLTATITDRNGQAVSGETVRVLGPETGEVLFEGTTDENGELETTLDQGEHDVRVGDETQSVSPSDEAEVDFSIDTSPRSTQATLGGRCSSVSSRSHLPKRSAGRESVANPGLSDGLMRPIRPCPARTLYAARVRRAVTHGAFEQPVSRTRRSVHANSRILCRSDLVGAQALGELG